MKLLLALVPVLAVASAKLQCRCDDMRFCMEQESFVMEACASGPQCMGILGGNQQQVQQCVQSKANQMREGMNCMATKMGGMGCTNGTPRNVQNSFQMPDHDAMGADMPGVVGQFVKCVKDCVRGSANPSRSPRPATNTRFGGVSTRFGGNTRFGTNTRFGQPNPRRGKRSPQCMQILDCDIDFQSFDMTRMMGLKQQCLGGGDMMQKMQEHCQCLERAGVNAQCSQLNQYFQRKMTSMMGQMGNLFNRNGGGGQSRPFPGIGGQNPMFGGQNRGFQPQTTFNRGNSRGIRFGSNPAFGNNRFTQG